MEEKNLLTDADVEKLVPSCSFFAKRPALLVAGAAVAVLSVFAIGRYSYLGSFEGVTLQEAGVWFLIFMALAVAVLAYVFNRTSSLKGACLVVGKITHISLSARNNVFIKVTYMFEGKEYETGRNVWKLGRLSSIEAGSKIFVAVPPGSPGRGWFGQDLEDNSDKLEAKPMGETLTGATTPPPIGPGTDRKSTSRAPRKAHQLAITLLVVVAAVYYGVRLVQISAVTLDKGTATAEKDPSYSGGHYRSAGGHYYVATFKYNVDGKAYEGKAEFNVDPGRTFKVYYAKSRPGWNYVPGSIGTVIDILAGSLAFLAIALYAAYRLKRLLRPGRTTAGAPEHQSTSHKL